jgi:hypothetical protein
MSKLNKQYIYILLALQLLQLLLALPSSVMASVSGCSVTLDQHNLSMRTEYSLIFNITNNDASNAVNWIKITKPSGLYTINGAMSSWIQEESAGYIIFKNRSLAPGANDTIYFNIVTGGSTETGTIWQVSASDSGSESGAVSCSGNLSSIIIPAAAPVITDISVTQLSETSLRVNWTTDRETTTVVDYGTTANYGQTAQNLNYTSSHSIDITGLTAGAVYHYRVKGTDRFEMTSQSADKTISLISAVLPTPTPTPPAGVSPTPTPVGYVAPTPVVTNTTTTVTNTVIIIPTPVADKTAPSLVLSALTDKIYSGAPAISGTAVDNIQVNDVEYNLDSGRVWYTVNNFTRSPSVKFSFIPAVPAGKHQLQVRARDNSGNVSPVTKISLTVDNTGPEITLLTLFDKPVPAAADIRIRVSDAGGVNDTAISLNNGTGWITGEKVSTPSATAGEYLFSLPPLDDGNYELSLKAADNAGNITQKSGGKFVVDRLPPQIGSALVSSGSLTLPINADRQYLTVPETENKITVSAVGGVTDLIGVIESGLNRTFITQIKFTKMPVGNLWSGSITFPGQGVYTLSLHAVDGAANAIDKYLGTFNVSDGGSVTDGMSPVSGARVTVYAFDPVVNRFVPWDSRMYGLSNPVMTSQSGKFRLILPPGRYYLTAGKSGFNQATTEIFEQSENLPAEIVLTISHQKMLNLLFFKIPLPDFSAKIITLKHDPVRPKNFTALVPQIPFPDTDLTDGEIILNQAAFRGKTTIAVNLNTWLPGAVTEVSILDEIVRDNPDIQLIVVVPHESQSQVNLFKIRGGFRVRMIADPDGLTRNVFNSGANPAFYLVDNNGLVTDSAGYFFNIRELTAAIDNVKIK